MTPCCDQLKELGFTTCIKNGHVAHKCYSCKRDITGQVLEMFLKDPFGTVKLKRKRGAE